MARNGPRWLLTLCLAGLVGCRTTVPYARPPLDVPAEHRAPPGGDAGGVAGVAAAADLPWWEVFRDPALQALLRDTVSNNHDLALAAARVQEARALVGLTHADRMPQVTGTLGASRDRASLELMPAGTRTTSTYAASIGASWELDLWGRIRHGEAAAIAEVVASEQGRRAVAVALVAQAAEGYVRLRTADLLLEITRRTVATRRSTFDLFEKRLGGGLSSRLEVARAAGDLAQSEADVPRLEQAIALQEHALSLLAGRNPGPIERGAALGAGLVPPPVPPGIPSALLERRPDVREAEERLKAATSRVGVAKAERLPRISLTALLGLQSRDLSDLLTGDALTGSLGGELLLPLVSGGRLCANERAAWARLEQARQSWLQAARSAFRDVADALVALRRSAEIRQQLERLVAARDEALKMAFTRFEGGLASYIEVLDSQRELLPAELQLAEARRDEVLAVIRLYRALGGGWQGALEPSCRCGVPARPAPLPLPAASGSLPAPPTAPDAPAPNPVAPNPAGPSPGAPGAAAADPVEPAGGPASPEAPAGTAYASPPAGPVPVVPAR